MGELLGALGLAWPRVVFYPGGLFALAASHLLMRWLAVCGGAPLWPAPPVTVLDLAPPLAVLTLLPLAPAPPFPFGLDLPVALVLLEWPRFRAAAVRGSAPAAVLRDYALPLAAALALAVATGGLELAALLRWPESVPERALLALGAALWLLGMPRLLRAGPGGAAGALRALGLLLVGALLLLGALAAGPGQWLPADRAGWLLPPLATAGAALAVGAALRIPERWLTRMGVAGCVAVLALAAYAASTVR
ncbi:MAG: hypothetical protein RMK84_00630 [Oscillochloridaceae bacterium]|nr:hypothetical protein [Chloroflexaceae bacterium]MDW8388601.1 hypothetical protein [Oscillochloridaceae bacterium]